MLQSSSSSPSSSSSHQARMDITVFERQRNVLQRLYHQQNDPSAFHFDHQELLLSNYTWQPDHHPSFAYPETKPDPHQSCSAISNNNNSSVTGATMSLPDHHLQCNSSLPNREPPSVSCSIKKRKAEFDTEEDQDQSKETGEAKSEITAKGERETSANASSKSNSKEGQKPDYIHVRARRGQATDSHSLAERARREKISKKMKCLQDLVPGCNKVSGKAGMLDEIINYVQSLQKQVEFLSMKLAAINPRMELNMDSFFAKEIPAYIAQLEAANSACYQYNPMQQGTSDTTMEQFQMIPQKAGSSSMPISEAFLPQLQQLSGFDPEWMSLFNVGFH